MVLPVTHLPSNPSPITRPLLDWRSLSLPARCRVDDVTTEAAGAPRPRLRASGRGQWVVLGRYPHARLLNHRCCSPVLMRPPLAESSVGGVSSKKEEKKNQACLKRGRSLVGEMVTCEVKRSKMLKQASKEEHQDEMLTNGRRLWCSLRKWRGRGAGVKYDFLKRKETPGHIESTF